MGTRAGFHSGELRAERAKIGGKQVINTIRLAPADFSIAPSIAGVPRIMGGILSGAFGFLDYPTNAVQPINYVSGVCLLGWGPDCNDKASVVVVTPSNIKRDTKANVNLWWTGISGAQTVGSQGSAIVDLDYRATSLWVSGAHQVSGVNYSLSGAFTNVTTTHCFQSGTHVDFRNILQKTTLAIPAKDVRPNSVLNLQLYRDPSAYDTLDGAVVMVVTEIEFVDE